MPHVSKDKAALRKSVLAQRETQPHVERAAADTLITAKLQSLAVYRNAQTVFSYISVESEVDTRGLIAQMLAEGKTVCAPRCLSGGIMHAHILTNLDDLEVGSLNIPVPPASSHIIDPQDLDLIIVPCLTCSRDGCRLGYGGGYYDRYLSAASRATKVILCRHDLLCDELPLEEHDVPVDIVITEQEIID